MTITINSSWTSTVTALNLNVGTGSYLATFNNGFTPGGGNFGWFYGSAPNYTAYGILNSAASQAFAIDGNFSYSGGEFDGSLNSLAFGTGLSYTPVPPPPPGVSSTAPVVTGELFSLTFSPAFNDTVNSGGPGDAVHELVYGLMIGEEDAILDVLNSNQIVFNGDVGNETFQGGALADTLNGGDGNDVLYGGGGADTIDGGAGADHLYGEGGSDTINGGAGADTIDGGGSSDFITGGAGADILTGGAGNDQFIYTDFSDSAFGAHDTITDFGNTTFGNNDVIDLTALGLLGFSGTATANSAWYSYDAGAGGTFVYADEDNNTTPDFAIFLAGYSGSLSGADVLV
jgi:Ca2+-binding RTX toxin-like protein